jgi:hypothetical protein
VHWRVEGRVRSPDGVLSGGHCGSATRAFRVQATDATRHRRPPAATGTGISANRRCIGAGAHWRPGASQCSEPCRPGMSQCVAGARTSALELPRFEPFASGGKTYTCQSGSAAQPRGFIWRAGFHSRISYMQSTEQRARITTGVQLRGAEGAQRLRATSASTAESYRSRLVSQSATHRAKIRSCRCPLDRRRMSPGSPVAITAASKSSAVATTNASTV